MMKLAGALRAGTGQDALPTRVAQVYVFTNGVAGKGPFGFQSDGFPRSEPGTDGYSPLRNLNTC